MTGRRGAISGVVLALTSVLLIAPMVSAESRTAAEFLPPDTIGYVCLGSEGLKAALEGTALAAILREEEVQALISPLTKKMGMEEGFALDKLPIPGEVKSVVEQLESILSGPVAIAMTGFPTDLTSVSGPEEFYTGLVIIADVRGNEEKAVELLDSLNESLAEKLGTNASPEAEEGRPPVHNERARIFSGDLQFKHKTKDGYLVASTSQATVDKVASLMDDPAAPKLADKPRFKAVHSRIAAPKNLYTVYVDLKMPMLLLEGMLLQNEPDAKALFEFSGLTGVEAVGVSLGVDGAGFRYTLDIYAPGAQTGLIHTALTGRALALSDLKMIPENSLFFLALNADPSASLQAMRDALTAVGEEDDFAEFLEDFQEELGFSLERDMLPAVEMPLLVYGTLPVGGPIPEVVALLKLRDPVKFQQCVDTLFSKAPPNDVAIQEYKGMKLYVVKADGPVSPSFAVSEDYAVAALFPHTLKSTLARLETPGPSIADSPAFEPALGRLSSETRLALVLDTKRIFTFGYGAAMPFLTMAASQGPRGDMPLDLSALPMSETISKHLFTQFVAVAREKDGIVVDSYSVLPQGVLPAAFAGANVRQPARRREQMGPGRGAAAGANRRVAPGETLKTIARAEDRFKLQLSADANADGVGEYGRIGELMRSGLLARLGPHELREGVLVDNGYVFKIFVPEDPDEAEERFAAYAWPEIPGSMTPNTAYFMDQTGVVSVTWMSTTMYDGLTGGPSADAAYTGEVFWSDVSRGKASPGNDGNVWRPIERERTRTEEATGEKSVETESSPEPVVE